MRSNIAVTIISLIFIFNLLASQTYGSTLEKKISVGVARGSIFNRMGFEDVLWKAGNSRKLLMKSPIDSTKDKVRKDEASTTRDDTKPDVLDIAGMDYSPAKRKPPIHN